MINPKSKVESELERKAEAEKKAKEGRLLFIIFGGIIVVLIALMFFNDHYAQMKAGGTRNVHDAAEPG